MARRTPRLSAPLTSWTIALTVLAASLTPATATAYEVRYGEDGNPVRWHDETLHVRLDTSLAALGPIEEVEATIIRALETWEDSGYLPFGFDVEITDDAEAGLFYDRPNTNDIVASTGPWPYGPNEAAITQTAYDPVTGALIDADIVFDASRSWSHADVPHANHVDLLDTATHEIGHLLGLAHSEIPDATMYQIGPRGSTLRRTLHEDDLGALRAAYGPPPALGRAPEAGCRVAGRSSQPPALAVFFALLLVLSRLRRAVIR